MTALITGATGLVGRRLLEAVPGAVVLSRDPERASGALGTAQVHRWDPSTELAPVEALRDVDVVFHLAGESVSEGRWSAAKKRRIRNSRILGTRNLVSAMAAAKVRPKVLVSASAVGFYGDRGDEELDESSVAGEGFLADVCAEWEDEAMKATVLGVRVVCVRVGIVLAREGGALSRMLRPFKMGVGGRLGDGKQWMPWIHVDDLVGLLLHASHTSSLEGPVNGVAPVPVRNSEFTRELGRVLHRPTFMPVPKAALRIAIGKMSAIVTASQRAVPAAAERTGYEFEHSHLRDALEDIIGSSRDEEAA